MPVTVGDLKDLIILEVGDVDPATGGRPVPSSAGIIAQQIDLLWERHAWADAVAMGLRPLYVKVSAIELVLGVLGGRRIDVRDQAAGLDVKASQTVTAYERKLQRAISEIGRIERGAAGRQGTRTRPAIGQLTTIRPVETDPPDPGTPIYGGGPPQDTRP